MNLHIDRDLLKSLLIMADIIETRDPYTGGHVWRVSQFTKLLAIKVGLPESEAILISIAAYLHDMGKVAIPDGILCKPTALTDEEYAVIKTHPSIGGKLLSGHPLSDLVYDAANQHHERIDGNGYPNGLTGDQISLIARIVSVADAFDAITSTRPYRQGLPVEKALEILEKDAGTQFDNELVAHMRELGEFGDLAHIVGHTAEGIPAVTCPHCGPVIAVPRDTHDGAIIYCRACKGKLWLHSSGKSFRAEMIGMAESPQNLEPTPNMSAVEDILVQLDSVISLEAH
jgi:HD-GYP domain-containing protein (c-di-GMP phosphodiesterase class II)